MRLVNVEFGHDPAVPDGGEEVILGENAITIFHEIGDQVEHLGLKRHLLGTAPELAAFGVKPMTFKEKLRQEDPFKVGSWSVSRAIIKPVSGTNQAALQVSRH